MDPVVALYAPEAYLLVQLLDVREGVDTDKTPDISDNPLNPAFLICLPGITGIDRKPIVSRKIQKLGVVSDIGLSAYYNAL